MAKVRDWEDGAGKKSGVKNETRRIQQKYETCLTRQSQIKNESVLSYDSEPDFEDTDHSLFVLPHLLPPIFCQQVGSDVMARVRDWEDGAGKKSGVKNETRRIQQKYETCLTRQSQIKNESV
ncbi:MAG TPA: hypothetical protein VK137_13365, partial [Planctomycetaceae bacterium]|nr:hypothetical protein [Planctomycetaceae bacterium]